MNYILVGKSPGFTSDKFVSSILKKFAKDGDMIVAYNDDGLVRTTCGKLGLGYAELDSGDMGEMASFQIVFTNKGEEVEMHNVFPTFTVTK